LPCTGCMLAVQVFCMKMPFDWLVMAEPAVTPLRAVTQRNYLECDDGEKWCAAVSTEIDWIPELLVHFCTSE
jgi:hypothetical protein